MCLKIKSLPDNNTPNPFPCYKKMIITDYMGIYLSTPVMASDLKTEFLSPEKASKKTVFKKGQIIYGGFIHALVDPPAMLSSEKRKLSRNGFVMLTTFDVILKVKACGVKAFGESNDLICKDLRFYPDVVDKIINNYIKARGA